VSFGTRSSSLFGESVVYDESTFKRASGAVDLFDADMGGTELLPSLREILLRAEGEYPRQVCITSVLRESLTAIFKLRFCC
jgi:hypothetical protein